MCYRDKTNYRNLTIQDYLQVFGSNFKSIFTLAFIILLPMGNIKYISYESDRKTGIWSGKCPSERPVRCICMKLALFEGTDCGSPGRILQSSQSVSQCDQWTGLIPEEVSIRNHLSVCVCVRLGVRERKTKWEKRKKNVWMTEMNVLCTWHAVCLCDIESRRLSVDGTKRAGWLMMEKPELHLPAASRTS